jgi:hypothetical protein
VRGQETHIKYKRGINTTILKHHSSDEEEMMREGDACVALLRSKVHGLVERNRALEEENKQLRHQVSQLKGQVSSLEGQDSGRRMQWKKQENSATSNNYSKEKQCVQNNDEAKEEAVDLNSSLSYNRQKFSRTTLMRSRAPRVPNPPPSPTTIEPVINMRKEGCMAAPPPPPPPPLPSKLLRGTKAVQRVPEVVELYRLLVRREGKIDSRSGCTGIPVATNSREMIGEIENRSAYVLAVSIHFLRATSICVTTNVVLLIFISTSYQFHGRTLKYQQKYGLTPRNYQYYHLNKGNLQNS